MEAAAAVAQKAIMYLVKAAAALDCWLLNGSTTERNT
jgi:hypothetical protein